MKKILVTGSAGFIGFHLAKGLLESGFDVVGIDNLNDYYDPQLKLDRLENLNAFVSEKNLQDSYQFTKLDISDEYALKDLFNQHDFDIVVNLAAQAGVRYSLENPNAYIVSNLVGYANILECCRHASIEHFIFASSSSVYGMNTKQPFSTSDNTDFPISLYAATKKSNEVMAYSYSSIYGMKNTALRFFTLYGEFGRPDMAIFKFTDSISKNKKIELFNNGNHLRDFTHIDTFLLLVEKLIMKPGKKKNPFNVFNIGNGKSEKFIKFINLIEKNLKKKSKIIKKPLQRGDVIKTHSSVDKIIKYLLLKNKPITKDLKQGIKEYVNWYKSYYLK